MEQAPEFLMDYLTTSITNYVTAVLLSTHYTFNHFCSAAFSLNTRNASNDAPTVKLECTVELKTCGGILVSSGSQ